MLLLSLPQSLGNWPGPGVWSHRRVSRWRAARGVADSEVPRGGSLTLVWNEHSNARRGAQTGFAKQRKRSPNFFSQLLAGHMINLLNSDRDP